MSTLENPYASSGTAWAAAWIQMSQEMETPPPSLEVFVQEYCDARDSGVHISPQELARRIIAQRGVSRLLPP